MKFWKAGNPRSTFYAYIQLCKNKVQSRFLVHRLIAMTFIGDPTGLEVNHIDGDHFNNALENLELLTRKQNMEHASRTGLVAYGERGGQATLTDNDVRQIRELRAQGYPYKLIAKLFNVTENYTGLIVRNKVRCI